VSKYNRNRRAGQSASRKRLSRRRWYENVGDGAKLSREHKNPNDQPKPVR
jgi:hypothetical protein